MKVFRTLSQLLAAGMLIFVSSQVYATAYSLSDYAWAYDSNQDGNISNDEIVSDDSFSFEGYTLVEVTTNSGTADLTSGATFSDYTYLTNTQTGVYAEALLNGTISSGSTIAYFNTTASDPTSQMEWYTASGDYILTVDLVTNDLGQQGRSVLTVIDGDLLVNQITLYLSVSDVEYGYFYIYDETLGEWVDFATLLAEGDELLFTSVTTSSAANEGDVSNEASAYIEGASGENPNSYAAAVGNASDLIDLTIAYQSDGTYMYSLSHDGGIDVDSDAVPEPGMLTLMGLALIGLAYLQRRRKDDGLSLAHS